MTYSLSKPAIDLPFDLLLGTDFSNWPSFWSTLVKLTFHWPTTVIIIATIINPSAIINNHHQSSSTDALFYLTDKEHRYYRVWDRVLGHFRTHFFIYMSFSSRLLLRILRSLTSFRSLSTLFRWSSIGRMNLWKFSIVKDFLLLYFLYFNLFLKPI